MWTVTYKWCDKIIITLIKKHEELKHDLKKKKKKESLDVTQKNI